MTMMWARMTSRQVRDRAVIGQGAPSVLVIEPLYLGRTVWDVLGATILSL
jgi:hypothetical protein